MGLHEWKYGHPLWASRDGVCYYNHMYKFHNDWIKEGVQFSIEVQNRGITLYEILRIRRQVGRFGSTGWYVVNRGEVEACVVLNQLLSMEPGKLCEYFEGLKTDVDLKNEELERERIELEEKKYCGFPLEGVM